MKTRATAKAKGTKVVLTTEKGRQITLEGVEAVKLAHDLMHAGERVLKRAGNWKPI